MKKSLNYLPFLALLLGVTAALAGMPTTEVAKREALISTPQGDMWIDITGQTIDVNYTCEDEPGRQCTRAFDALNNPLPDEAQPGRYQP